MSEVGVSSAGSTEPVAPGTPLASIPPIAPGTLFAGKYRIERVIAQGGMGVVVAARHLALDKSVAIKFLKPEARANREIVERFAREGRLAAKITSEHVVRVHDVAALDEVGPYLVMELLHGKPLSDIVEESAPLPPARAIDYVLQVCDALAHAHGLGMVHRDIKPENLLLADRVANTPIVKLIDFGITKLTPRQGEKGNWAFETADTARFGTPLYMSPEQLRSSAAVDARSDIWSVGVLLHELLTGATPFDAEDLPRLCTAILHAEPTKLRTVRAGLPVELEASVLRCLERDPSRRYRNVAELAQDLAPFGPPDAHVRAEQAKRIVLNAGYSVRPPLPSSGSLDAASLAEPPSTHTFPSTEAFAVPTTPRRRAGTMAVVAGAAVVLCAVLLLVRRGSAPAPHLAASQASAAPTVASIEAPAPPPPSVSQSPESPPSVVSASADAVPPAPTQSARPRARPPAAAPPSSHVPDSRAAFGERK